MEELNKGLEISLSGPVADDYVEKALEQIHAWGLAMPDVAPLVLDFGLGEFDKVGEIEFWIANEIDAGYCGKFLFVFADQTCPLHMHKNKLETFFVVKGKLDLRFGDEKAVLPAGGVLRVETGVLHQFTGIGAALLLEVSKPNIIADNFFENRRIPIGGNFDGHDGAK